MAILIKCISLSFCFLFLPLSEVTHASRGSACNSPTIEALIQTHSAKKQKVDLEYSRIETDVTEFEKILKDSQADIAKICQSLPKLNEIKNYNINVDLNVPEPTKEFREAIIKWSEEITQDPNCRTSPNVQINIQKYHQALKPNIGEIQGMSDKIRGITDRIAQMKSQVPGLVRLVADRSSGGQGCDEDPAKKKAPTPTKPTAADTPGRIITDATPDPVATAGARYAAVDPALAGSGRDKLPEGATSAHAPRAPAAPANPPLPPSDPRKPNIPSHAARVEPKDTATQEVRPTVKDPPPAAAVAPAPVAGAADPKDPNPKAAPPVAAVGGPTGPTVAHQHRPFNVDTGAAPSNDDLSPKEGSRAQRKEPGSFFGRAIKGITNALGLSTNDAPQFASADPGTNGGVGSASATAANQASQQPTARQTQSQTQPDKGEGKAAASRQQLPPVGSRILNNPPHQENPSAEQNSNSQRQTNYVYYSGNGGTQQAAPTSPSNSTNATAPTSESRGSTGAFAPRPSPGSDEHPCKNLESTECKRWKCEQGVAPCEAPKTASIKNKPTKIYEGEETGGGSAKDPIVANAVDPQPLVPTAKTKPAAEPKVTEEKSKTVTAKATSVLPNRTTENRKLPTATEDSKLNLVAESKDNRMNAPTWFKHLPKFLLDSSLIQAFFRTKGGRYIAGERIEIAHMHADLFSNVNRAYASFGDSLNR